jgi:Smg protein
MNETMVDVLIYLYENYMDAEASPPTDQGELRDELSMAGFPSLEIDKAFQWLEELARQQEVGDTSEHRPHSVRIFSEEEALRLDTGCRGLLLFLEQSEILDPHSRELVIDRAMALDATAVSEEDLKWIVLLVLISQPGRELAFAQMEDMVYSQEPVYLH